MSVSLSVIGGCKMLMVFSPSSMFQSILVLSIYGFVLPIFGELLCVGGLCRFAHVRGRFTPAHRLYLFSG
jgi:hypothetical protein